MWKKNLTTLIFIIMKYLKEENEYHLMEEKGQRRNLSNLAKH